MQSPVNEPFLLLKRIYILEDSNLSKAEDRILAHEAFVDVAIKIKPLHFVCLGFFVPR